MKWNMGWANDFYQYLSLDPIYRSYHHKALNFPLMYAFSENYCLPISHDEVVHGKKSMIDKMHGSVEDKFLQMRAALLLMMTYPGKKMLFMGTEFAQFREWNFDDSLEWFMLDYPNHKNMRDYVRALNMFYLSHSELWDLDFNPEGFTWLLPDENDKNCVAFTRQNKKGETLIVLINFSGVDQTLTFKTRKGVSLDLVFSTNFSAGSPSTPIVKRGRSYFADVKIARFSGIILVTNNGKLKYNL